MINKIDIVVILEITATASVENWHTTVTIIRNKMINSCLVIIIPY